MTGVSRTLVQGGATTQAYTAGSSVATTYARPPTYTAGSIGTVPMTAAPRPATFANAVPTLGSISTGMPVIGASSVVQQQPMPVQMMVQTGVVQGARPMTTTTTGYAGGVQQVNQAQLAYNLQVQALNTAIQLEAQIPKQLDALKPSKEAMEKRKKARDLENKRFELQKCERELMGLQVDPQVQRAHDRQKFVQAAAEEQDKVLDCQHALEEQKIAALKAQLAVAKFDAGQIDADGKEIRAPPMELSPWLNDADVQKLIKDKQAKPADKDDKKDDKKDKK